MTQAICDITTDEVNVDVVVEPQADTMVEVANRAGGMEQVFHDNTLIGNGNSVDLGVNTEIIATKEYVDESKADAYTKTEIDNKFTVANAQIDANADAIQKTREDYIQADSEIHQILNAHASELTTHRNDIDGLGDQVSAIEEKIPETASAENPLVTRSEISSVYKFKGSVATYNDLPTGATVGDVYNVTDTGANYAWDGSAWDKLSETVDLSSYATTAYVNAREQEIRDDANQADSELQSQITAQASAITANTTSINGVKAVIPDGTSDTNPLINKQQLLDEEIDIREDLNSGLSELQTQITAQAAEIAGKQDQLTAGENITIVDNVISASGGGDYLPLSGGTLTGPMVIDSIDRPQMRIKYDLYTWDFRVSSSGLHLYSGVGGNTSWLISFGIWGEIYPGSAFQSIGMSGYPFKKIYVNKLNAGGDGVDLIVPTGGGTLARIEDIDAIGGEGAAGQVLTKTDTGMVWTTVSGGGIADVVHDDTLTGSGTDAAPLGVNTEVIATKEDLEHSENNTLTEVMANLDETVWPEINILKSDKQDKLTAGENITIDEDGVISAAGGGTTLPDQTGNAGAFLQTDGASTKWAGYCSVNEGGTYSAVVFDPAGKTTSDIKTSGRVAIAPSGNTGALSVSLLGSASGVAAIGIGYGVRAGGFYSVAVGGNCNTSGANSIALGYSSYASGNYSIAFGASSNASKKYAIQLGRGTNNTENTLCVGNENGNFEMMSADGTIPAERMSATTGTTGQVLTKTDTGMAWADASGGDDDIDCGVMS